ncbi:MAG: hypothetical protein HY288_05915 [Planctomycetia bacterium]|nr:hypothetical protein [Planctomycetia bacterium]
MIPKTIHYCWFGATPPSDLIRRCIDSWRRVMPGYRINEWNEGNSPIDNAYTKTVFRKRLWSKLSNYVRLHALYTEGGIYLDADVEVIRPFDPLLRDPCFLGFQLPWHQTDWVNTAVLAAQSGHPFIKSCMQLTLKLFTEERRIYRSPEVSTKALKAMGLSHYGLQTIEDVKLYPTEFFYPYAWWEDFSADRITDSTYCVHRWAGSWVKKEPLVLKMVKDFRRAVGLTTGKRAA